jgi:hypothetical protein
MNGVKHEREWKGSRMWTWPDLLAGLTSLRIRSETQIIKIPYITAALFCQLLNDRTKWARGTYAAGQINVNTNKVFASTLSPNVNVLVQFWDVSSEMYNVGAKRSRPIIVVGTRDVMPPSLLINVGSYCWELETRGIWLWLSMGIEWVQEVSWFTLMWWDETT